MPEKGQGPDIPETQAPSISKEEKKERRGPMEPVYTSKTEKVNIDPNLAAHQERFNERLAGFKERLTKLPNQLSEETKAIETELNALEIRMNDSSITTKRAGQIAQGTMDDLEGRIKELESKKPTPTLPPPITPRTKTVIPPPIVSNPAAMSVSNEQRKASVDGYNREIVSLLAAFKRRDPGATKLKQCEDLFKHLFTEKDYAKSEPELKKLKEDLEQELKGINPRETIVGKPQPKAQITASKPELTPAKTLSEFQGTIGEQCSAIAENSYMYLKNDQNSLRNIADPQNTILFATNNIKVALERKSKDNLKLALNDLSRGLEELHELVKSSKNIPEEPSEVKPEHTYEQVLAEIERMQRYITATVSNMPKKA